MTIQVDFSKLRANDALDMAIAIEEEGSYYYDQLADWIGDNNPEVSDFFRRMSVREKRHHDQVVALREKLFAGKPSSHAEKVSWGVEAPDFDARRVSRKRGLEFFAKIRGRDIVLRGQSNQYVSVRTELLHLRIIEAIGAQVGTDCLDVGHFGVSDLEQYAAREVDAELQTAGCERSNRGVVAVATSVGERGGGRRSRTPGRPAPWSRPGVGPHPRQQRCRRPEPGSCRRG
jgi:hypothetical protein